jgi:hypothetical protein
MKIRDDPRISGSQMPRDNPGLWTTSPELQQRIENWVAAGAPADSIPADSSRLGPGRIEF